MRHTLFAIVSAVLLAGCAGDPEPPLVRTGPDAVPVSADELCTYAPDEDAWLCEAPSDGEAEKACIIIWQGCPGGWEPCLLAPNCISYCGGCLES